MKKTIAAVLLLAAAVGGAFAADMRLEEAVGHKAPLYEGSAIRYEWMEEGLVVLKNESGGAIEVDADDIPAYIAFSMLSQDPDEAFKALAEAKMECTENEGVWCAFPPDGGFIRLGVEVSEGASRLICRTTMEGPFLVSDGTTTLKSEGADVSEALVALLRESLATGTLRIVAQGMPLEATKEDLARLSAVLRLHDAATPKMQ